MYNESNSPAYLVTVPYNDLKRLEERDLLASEYESLIEKIGTVLNSKGSVVIGRDDEAEKILNILLHRRRKIMSAPF